MRHDDELRLFVYIVLLMLLGLYGWKQFDRYQKEKEIIKVEQDKLKAKNWESSHSNLFDLIAIDGVVITNITASGLIAGGGGGGAVIILCKP